jgi:hypothetical protein
MILVRAGGEDAEDNPAGAGEPVFDLEGREREAMLAWVGENLPLVRRSATGHRVLYWSLSVGFVTGLAAHVGGFLLKASAGTEFLALLADLLYALGLALWTGVVVVGFIEVWPQTKRRHYKEALAAYEASARRKAAPADPPGSGSPSGEGS